MRLSLNTLAMLASMGDTSARYALNQIYSIGNSVDYVCARNGQIWFAADY
jgi:hypothetical protein